MSQDRLQILSEMIAAGWGEVPQGRIPENWREIPGPAITGRKVRIEVDQHVMFIDPLTAEGIHEPLGDVTPAAKVNQDAACAMRNEIERRNGRPRGSRKRFARPSLEMRQAALFARMQKRRLRQQRQNAFIARMGRKKRRRVA